MWLALAAVAMILCVGIAVDLGGHVHAQQRAHAPRRPSRPHRR